MSLTLETLEEYYAPNVMLWHARKNRVGWVQRRDRRDRRRRRGHTYDRAGRPL